MDEYLSHLDVSADYNIDDLPSQFAHVLSWMHIDQYSEPDELQVSVLLRAVLFLYGNLEIHGQQLENKLKECQLIPKHELNSLLAKFHSGTILSDVCEKLLSTITGPNHILEIQDFCERFLDVNQYTRLLSKVRESRYSQQDEDRVTSEAKYLITTTFLLQTPDKIELAIKRIVDNVEFDVLAWIINFEEPLTYFSMKCLIIQKELCSSLESGLVSAKFITSMYEVVALNEDGLSTFFKCLQNPIFASSLMTFFISYLNAIEASTKSAKQARLIQHDILHVSFLMAGMMSRKSSCRIEFHKKLAAVRVNANVLLSISHLNFTYDF